MEPEKNSRRERSEGKMSGAGVIARVLAGGLLFFFLLLQLSYIHRGYDRLMRFFRLFFALRALAILSATAFPSLVRLSILPVLVRLTVDVVAIVLISF